MPRFTARRSGDDDVPTGAAEAQGAVVLATAPDDLPVPCTLDLRLRTSAEPASLAVVRHAVGGTASALGIGPAGVADVRLALTEAVTAAIRRDEAVGGPEPSDVEVRAWIEDHALRVAVRDQSPGPRNLPLPLVAAVSDAVELTHLPGGGTEITMTFATGG